jgi:hypothetical protein
VPLKRARWLRLAPTLRETQLTGSVVAPPVSLPLSDTPDDELAWRAVRRHSDRQLGGRSRDKSDHREMRG